MSETKSVSIYNIPNALTSIRFLLAIAVMLLIPMGNYTAALIIFAIAVSTDWMDGYWARKYGQVTKLGRIFDPFVDKIIICGTFIALVEIPNSPVASWMATIVIGSELLVTSLRGMIEGAGGDFSANQLGKWKMVLQSGAAISVLCGLIQPDTPLLDNLSLAFLWGAIALTVYSGIDYSRAAARIMSSNKSQSSDEE
ncbi:MAG: CDP-diacylglycerol--glycerol-3-phosphate 3-phosphatidyltransferase [Planctomycetota bacterium]|nr:CDP-diacylglycerol--glycerol-3-phosphate 3-phosphatidyltransferase [Planctomycetota bacterium]